MVSQSISTVLFPNLVRMNEGDQQKYTQVYFRLSLAISIFLSLLLALLAYPLMVYVFGVEYVDAVIVIFLLLPGIIAISGSRVLSNSIAALGRPELNIYSSVAVLTINTLGNVMLIPSYGIRGGAIATSIAYFVNMLVRTAIYCKLSDTSLRSLLVFSRRDFTAA